MLVVMSTILLAILVVGTAAMIGSPLYLILAGTLLSVVFQLLARPGDRREPPLRHH